MAPEENALFLSFLSRLESARYRRDISAQVYLAPTYLCTLFKEETGSTINNCLDSINWMALERGSGEISRMARLLGKFYRLSLSGGRQTVSLENEVEHSKIYVEIMQIRFDGQIRMRYQVEEGTLAQQVPKLILQPLLENAIRHGISCRESQEGTIRVRVFTRGDFLVLEVTDTGAGMDKETLGALRASLSSAQGSIGYGMRNVDRRIRFAFGEGSGLRVRSIARRGTKVEVLCRLTGPK